MIAWRIACGLLLLVLVTSPSAVAQSTGGSFGSRSGSWGSSGSGRSVGSSRSSGLGSSRMGSSRMGSSRFGSSRSSELGASPSSSFGSSTSSRSGGAMPPPDPWSESRRHLGAPSRTAAERAALRPLREWRPPGPAFFVAVFLIAFALTWIPAAVTRLRRPAGRAATVQRLSVGFDWTVREDLAARLHELSTTISLHGPAERAAAARAVLALLWDRLPAARYAYVDAQAIPLADAPAALERLATDLRARFRYETKGARDAAPAPALAPRPEEGAGMIVVSLVVGGVFEARASRISDGASLEVAMRAVGAAAPLDALEVVWSPAEPDDRMSSYELERVYPELNTLAEAADVGTLACAHCGAPRPAELAACPRCGSAARA